MGSKNVGKNAEYYLGLEYPVVLRKLRVDEGGGYLATIPQLGRMTFIADGETAQEALDSLDDLRKALIPELLSQGVVLPEPVSEEQPSEEYSGKVLVRMPLDVHARVASDAKKNGCSLNARINQYISEGLGRSANSEAVSEAVRVAMAQEFDRQAVLQGRFVPASPIRLQWETSELLDPVRTGHTNKEFMRVG